MKCKRVGKKNANTDNTPMCYRKETEELGKKPLHRPPSSN